MKLVVTVFTAIVLELVMPSLYAQDLLANHTYKVTFYNVKSQSGSVLPESACQAMMKTFTFTVQGKHYHYNQSDNPAYSNHQAVAFLKLRNDQFLELDDMVTKFSYSDKTYQFVSHFSSVTSINPFIRRGIVINAYCKAAYVALLDDSEELESVSANS